MLKDLCRLINPPVSDSGSAAAHPKKAAAGSARGEQTTTFPPAPRANTSNTERKCQETGATCPERARIFIGVAGAFFTLLCAISLDKICGSRRVKNFLDRLPQGYFKVLLEHLVYFLQVSLFNLS